MDIRGLLVLTFAIRCTFADEDDSPVWGMTGKSVRLACDLPLSYPVPRVRWVDFVYNTDANPSVIFSSENNEALGVDGEHENADNFHVSSDFALTISNLRVDRDPGNYTCESQLGNTKLRRSYYLTVGSKPECSGEVDLIEGSRTVLECHSEYSGYQPTLVWLRGSEEIESRDNFEIRLAKRSLDLTATHRDDNMRYTCQMKIENVVKECTLTLRVKYFTRDLRLTPNSDTLRVGDELTCSAMGNPTPMVTLEPLSSKAKSGDGWKSIVIEPEWQDNQINVKCVASNSINGKIEIIRKNVTIDVIEAQKMAEPLAASALSLTSAVIIGIIVAVVILACLAVIAVIIIFIRRKNQSPPKGSEPLRTTEEDYNSHGQYGQSV